MASSLPAPPRGLAGAGTCLQSHGLLAKGLFSASPLWLPWAGLWGERGTQRHFSPWSPSQRHWGLLHEGTLARRAGKEGGREAAVPQRRRQPLCCRAGVAREPSLLGWAWARSAATWLDKVCSMAVVFLLPQGGQQVAQGQPPAPQELAQPAAEDQQQRGHHQDDCWQPGHLRGAEPPEPSRGARAPPERPAGGGGEGTLPLPAGYSLPGPAQLCSSELAGCLRSSANAPGGAAGKSSSPTAEQQPGSGVGKAVGAVPSHPGRNQWFAVCR